MSTWKDAISNNTGSPRASPSTQEGPEPTGGGEVGPQKPRPVCLPSLPVSLNLVCQFIGSVTLANS